MAKPGETQCRLLRSQRQIGVRHYLQMLDSDSAGASQNPTRYLHATGGTEENADCGMNAQIITA